jgi:hypothetical protein
MYKDLAVNYKDLATKQLKDGDLRGAQLSLKSLERILPELIPEDKATAEENYKDLQRKLHLKLSGRN